MGSPSRTESSSECLCERQANAPEQTVALPATTMPCKDCFRLEQCALIPMLNNDGTSLLTVAAPIAAATTATVTLVKTLVTQASRPDVNCISCSKLSCRGQAKEPKDEPARQQFKKQNN